MLTEQAAKRLYHSGMEPTVTKLLELDALNDELQSRIDRLTRNSSNSSKPPSSDIVKPKQDRAARRREEKMKKKKKRKGGQLGHPKHERPEMSTDELSERFLRQLSSCPDCGGKLSRATDAQDKVVQQYEIEPEVVKKIEYRSDAWWCPQCRRYHYASIPDEVHRAGLFKEHISAMVCLLKYAGNMSIHGIQKYLRDVFGVRVSRGYLCKVIKKGARALEATYYELLNELRSEKIVNADETGHKENGARRWTWVFRTELYALFKISPSRGSEVLLEVLGEEFNGVLGCDYFSAYHKYMKDWNVVLQFCLAHLIRDVKALVDSHDTSLKNYGTKVLDALRGLFRVIHRRDTMTPERFTRELNRAKKAIFNAATGYVPQRGPAMNLAKRFRENGKAYFTFITTPGLEPTNNCAEQAIRFVVIYRRVSQGTRSENGNIACERFFTVIASCALQNRSAFLFIKDAFNRYFRGLPGPSLRPVPTAPS